MHKTLPPVLSPGGASLAWTEIGMHRREWPGAGSELLQGQVKDTRGGGREERRWDRLGAGGGGLFVFTTINAS